MKSLIVIAIAVHLVSVSGSRIIQQDLDIDNGRDSISVDSSDAIIAGQNLDELLDMGTSEDARLEKRVHVPCVDSYCIYCKWKLCLNVTHVRHEKKLHMKITFKDHSLYEKKIEIREWSRCQKVKIWKIDITPCLALSELRIVKGKVCSTLSISGMHFIHKKFEDVCV